MDLDSWWKVIEAAIHAMSRPAEPAGPEWDPEDDDENRRHLVHLEDLAGHPPAIW